MYSAKEIASFFIQKGLDEDNPVTQMKLQKLIYFANGFLLATSSGERRLVEETFEAWDFGPVLPSIYHEYKLFGSNPIVKNNVVLKILGRPLNLELSKNVKEEDVKILEDVWNSLKVFTALELSTVTHRENGAWSKVYKPERRSVPIKEEDIIEEMKPLIKR